MEQRQRNGRPTQNRCPYDPANYIIARITIYFCSCVQNMILDIVYCSIAEIYVCPKENKKQDAAYRV